MSARQRSRGFWSRSAWARSNGAESTRFTNAEPGLSAPFGSPSDQLEPHSHGDHAQREPDHGDRSGQADHRPDEQKDRSDQEPDDDHATLLSSVKKDGGRCGL